MITIQNQFFFLATRFPADLLAMDHASVPARFEVLDHPSLLANQLVAVGSFDRLRGLASLTVVILHYRNLNDKWNEALINTNPFWDQLILVYKFGWIGVEFFFVLSGFIFFWKYGEMIGNKTITLTNFAVLRLTRLYPLHVATLILTALLQYLVFAKSNTTFVYGNNDIYHMLLQLSFLNYGWIEVGHSFNAPAWSIALEMGMYFLFYAACFGRKNRALIALGLMMLFLHVHIRGPIPNVPMLNEPFTRVGYCFFMGGLLHFLYEKVKNAGKIMEYIGAALAGAVLILAASSPTSMATPPSRWIWGRGLTRTSRWQTLSPAFSRC